MSNWSNGILIFIIIYFTFCIVEIIYTADSPAGEFGEMTSTELIPALIGYWIAARSFKKKDSKDDTKA